MDIDLRNTKINATGWSDAEKIEFQEYCFSKGCNDSNITTDFDYVVIDCELDIDYCDMRIFKQVDGQLVKDITEEWANRNKDDGLDMVFGGTELCEFCGVAGDKGKCQEKHPLVTSMIEKPRAYTSSNVADAVRDLKKGDKVDFLNEAECWESCYLVDIHPFNNYPYQCEDDAFDTIRKSQKPVNPYEELEENGKYKVTGLSDRTDLNLLWLSYDGVSLALDEWVSHKDFAGYVHSNGELRLMAWCFSTGHAIGVRFKVGE